MKKLKNHLLYYREIYIFIPLAIAIVLGSIAFYHVITGREPIEDIGGIVGWSLNFLGLVLVIVLTGITKPHLFDDINTQGAPWWRVLLDSCETIFLLCFFAYLLWY